MKEHIKRKMKTTKNGCLETNCENMQIGKDTKWYHKGADKNKRIVDWTEQKHLIWYEYFQRIEEGILKKIMKCISTGNKEAGQKM